MYRQGALISSLSTVRLVGPSHEVFQDAYKPASSNAGSFVRETAAVEPYTCISNRY